MSKKAFRNVPRICWLDSIFNRFHRLGTLLTAVMLASICYVLAAFPLIASSQATLAVEKALPLGSLGLIFVLSACRFLTKRYGHGLMRIREALDEPAYPAFDKITNELLATMRATRGHLMPAFVIWVPTFSNYQRFGTRIVRFL